MLITRAVSGSASHLTGRPPSQRPSDERQRQSGAADASCRAGSLFSQAVTINSLPRRRVLRFWFHAKRAPLAFPPAVANGSSLPTPDLPPALPPFRPSARPSALPTFRPPFCPSDLPPATPPPRPVPRPVGTHTMALLHNTRVRPVATSIGPAAGRPPRPRRR